VPTTRAAISSPDRSRLQRWLPWIAGVVLVAGIAGVLIRFVGNTANTNVPQVSNRPAVVPKHDKTVKLSAAARQVAGQFILTAVTRKDLARAWTLTAPALHEDLTYKQWLTGNIPVIPYPADVNLAPMKIDYSYADRALVEVFLLPKQGSKVKPALFLLGVHRFGTGAKAHWLVDYWAPRATPSIPLSSSRG
jgi:hypothetical protein